MNDYRDLLKKKIAEQQTKNKKYSQAFYATKMNVSRTYLSLVLSKKKHLSSEKLDILAAALKLSNQDCVEVVNSFSKLVLNQKYLTKAISRLRRMSVQKYSETPVQNFSSEERRLTYDDLKSTLFALMSSIPNGDIKKAHQALSDKSVDLQTVQKSVMWLVRNGFLKQVISEGKPSYQAVKSFLRTSEKPGLSKYTPWLEKTLEVFKEPTSYTPIRIQSMTFSFDEKTFEELNHECTRFINKVKELSDKSGKDKVLIAYVQNLFYTLAVINNEDR